MGIQLTGMASGLDTSSMIKELMAIERTKVDDKERDKTLVEWKKEAWEEVNTKLYDFYKNELFDLKTYGSYNLKTIQSSNESVVKTLNATGDASGTYSIDVTAIASAASITSDEVYLTGGTTTAHGTSTAANVLGLGTSDTKTITISVDGGTTNYDVDISSTDTMDAVAAKIEALNIGIRAEFDDNFGRFFLSSEETGASQMIDLGGDAATLSTLGFSTTTATGENTVFKYNGTELTSETNEIAVNEIKFNVMGTGSATVTVARDTDAIYDKIKSFVTKYNELTEEINGLLDEEYVLSDYKPLTSEEKESMSDDEVELWETKIKDSLLRNDPILTTLKDVMRSTIGVSSGVDVGEFKYTDISDIGIVTGKYEEKGKLHIYGDEDDDDYGSKDNLLKELLVEDPEEVTKLLTALGQQLYDKFTTSMKSTSISSAFTFYNDKSMDDEIDGYEDDIYSLEQRLEDIEERYTAQFAAMEQAIQKANSTSEWLTQQLS